jgi:hypothetical protein
LFACKQRLRVSLTLVVEFTIVILGQFHQNYEGVVLDTYCGNQSLSRVCRNYLCKYSTKIMLKCNVSEIFETVLRLPVRPVFFPKAMQVVGNSLVVISGYLLRPS